MARIAHLLDHPGEGDSRVFRAAYAQCNAGHNVVIFALNRNGAKSPETNHPNCKIVQCNFDDERVIPAISWLSSVLRQTKRSKTRNISANGSDSTVTNTSLITRLKRELGLLFWHRATFQAINAPVIAFKPDLIHAHDLSMLPSGGKLASILTASLIYDSHEYERSRNLISHERAERIRISFENKSIKKADIIITVSDSIADQIATDHDIHRPLVIPNASNESVKKSLTREDLGLPLTAKIAVYAGSLQPGRGLKIAIDALISIEDWNLLIIGAATPARTKELQDYAFYKKVEDRVFIHAPVHHSKVCDVIALCDLSLIPMQNTCLSYNYSLPNKLFQSIRAGVPVLSTPLFEISAFLNHFEAGRVSKGFLPIDIAKELAIKMPKGPSNEADLQAYSGIAVAKCYQNITAALINDTPLPESKRLPHMTASRT